MRTARVLVDPLTSTCFGSGAKLADVGGAAHMVAGDQNDAFSEAVVAFLQHDVRRDPSRFDSRRRHGLQEWGPEARPGV
jgi:hypothetical protein